jgi:Proteasome-substrate-size regulator, mid region
MAPDGFHSPPSSVPTPLGSPFQSGANTPIPQENRKGALGDFLSAPLSKGYIKARTYLAGSKALDGLARLVASTESFFHPSNSGTWTVDVGIFSIVINNVPLCLCLCEIIAENCSADVRFYSLSSAKRVHQVRR